MVSALLPLQNLFQRRAQYPRSPTPSLLCLGAWPSMQAHSWRLFPAVQWTFRALRILVSTDRMHLVFILYSDGFRKREVHLNTRVCFCSLVEMFIHTWYIVHLNADIPSFPWTQFGLYPVQCWRLRDSRRKSNNHCLFYERWAIFWSVLIRICTNINFEKDKIMKWHTFHNSRWRSSPTLLVGNRALYRPLEDGRRSRS